MKSVTAGELLQQAERINAARQRLRGAGFERLGLDNSDMAYAMLEFLVGRGRGAAWDDFLREALEEVIRESADREVGHA